jgi:hypothetical protein
MRPMFSHLDIRRLLFLPSALCLMSLSPCGGTPAPPGGQVLKSMTAFDGGKFDASGVADVPGTDGVLFVDNGREGQVFWMGLDQNGGQVGANKSFSTGAVKWTSAI